MNFVSRHVIVEYVFEGVPDTALPRLPVEVQRAVRHFTDRNQLPTDAAVRERVLGGAADAPGADGTVARVRILLPDRVALDLALDRSFETGGNVVRERPLSALELHRLVRRSAAVRVRQLRDANHAAARRRAARRVASRANPREPGGARRQSSPVRPTCAVCLEVVRYRTQRVYLECRHVFHHACAVGALRTLPRRCPVCRAAVDLSARPGDPPAPHTRAHRRAQHAADEGHESGGPEIVL
jgi:hypothetical protein